MVVGGREVKQLTEEARRLQCTSTVGSEATLPRDYCDGKWKAATIVTRFRSHYVIPSQGEGGNTMNSMCIRPADATTTSIGHYHALMPYVHL